MATRVLTNGKIFTANANEPWAQAVVLEGNKIAYVGSTEGATQFAGKDVQVEDLDGKLVTPGLIDGHLHLFAATALDGLLSLGNMTREQMLDAISQDVAKHPEREAYTGLGWAEEAFGEKGPNKADLDVICPNKPMAYFDASMHAVWCNSKALEAADVTRDTPDIDPAAGVLYVRDKDGEPTGYCKEIASLTHVMGSAKYFDEEAMEKASDEFMQHCAQHGITSIVDCGSLSFLTYLINGDLCAKMDTNECPVRFNFCGYAGADGLYEASFADAVKFAEKYNDDRFFCTFHKLFNDGTLETWSAAIPNAYPNGEVITPSMTVDALAAEFERCAKAALDVNIHAIGSDAIHNVLEAARVVREKGYDDLRIICSHTSYPYPQDLELFGKYDVFSNTTGLWLSETDEETEALVKGLTQSKPYAMKSILNGGARVGLGSDFPTDPTSFPPMQNAECLVTRQPIGQVDGYVHDANEALTVAEVLLGYTINNAYQMRKEDVLGSIEVGKYADLTVFSQDLFEIDPHEIHGVAVCETIKDGITTYKA